MLLKGRNIQNGEEEKGKQNSFSMKLTPLWLSYFPLVYLLTAMYFNVLIKSTASQSRQMCLKKPGAAEDTKVMIQTIMDVIVSCMNNSNPFQSRTEKLNFKTQSDVRWQPL